MNNNEKEIESKKLMIETQGKNNDAVQRLLSEIIPHLKEIAQKDDTYLYLNLSPRDNGIELSIATNGYGFDGCGRDIRRI